MRMIDLGLKDIRQILRDKRSFLFLVAMPIIFTLFMGFIYRSGEGSELQNLSMSLAWVEAEPGGGLSELLYTHLEESHDVKLIHMEREAAFAALKQGEMDGVLVIPHGFDGLLGQMLAGASSGEKIDWQFKLTTDMTSLDGNALYQLLRDPVTQFISAVGIGLVKADVLGIRDEYAPMVEQAWAEWRSNSSQRFVRVEQTIAEEPGSWFGDNPFNQASPGILVQFAVFGLVTTSQMLVRERKSRTLQRQMVTALKAREILLGHMLAMFTIVFMQITLLILFGQWILGVRYSREPLGVLLMAVALGLWVSSMGLLIGLLAKRDDQVILYSMVAMFVFSALGGAWFPIEIAGRVFVRIGKLLPSAWAMTGFQNILIRGQGISSIWQPVCILLVYALGFILVSVWQFRRREVE